MTSKQTEALKLALEALKQIDEAMPFPVAKFAQAAIREALEQPAQQQCKFPLCHNEEYQQALAEQIKRELYTGESAQRKPLTDKRVDELLDDVLEGGSLVDVVRAIEAAHGIK